MAESAPEKPNYLVIFIVSVLAGALLSLVSIHFLHFNPLNLFHKKAPVVVVKPAPVVIPGEQPTYEDVVATPIVPPAVVTPVKATPVAAPVVAPAPVPVLTPAEAISVVKAAGPYLNHGNFVHGNSNPSWPYSPDHHRR